LIAFVRDDSRETAVVVRDMTNGQERVVDKGMALDPWFNPNGRELLYANLKSGGDLDLYVAPVDGSGAPQATAKQGLQLRPQMSRDGKTVHLSKTRAGGDQVIMRRGASGEEIALLTGNIISQTRPALSPDGSLLAYNWPGIAGWELQLMSTDRLGAPITLVADKRGRPYAPAWSADGKWIYFSQADANAVFHLYRVAAVGGKVQEIQVQAWDYGVPTSTLHVVSTTPVRLNARDATGHPLIPATGMVRFDGQTGTPYFYSPGTIELQVPAGEITVLAARGLASRPGTVKVNTSPGGVHTAQVALTNVWDAAANGWYSGDHHFHLNYGGQIDLAPADLIPLMQGEALDVGTPMLANLHNRFENQEHWSFRSVGSGSPMLRFAQEVRSHFLGHVGLLGTSELFWPWIWGPGYQAYGTDDRPNAVPLNEGQRQGGLGLYVHPVSSPTPFTDAGLSSVPVALVADAAHGAVDLLELVCLWSNSVGTTELWYRLLNAGFPVMPSAGTDVMTDIYRTMAVGTTRVYVKPEGALSWDSYMAGLKAGRSFVTTGPMIELLVGAAGSALGPGGVVTRGRNVPYDVKVHSAVPVDSVSLVVNGKTVRSLGVPNAEGHLVVTGTIALPDSGWVGVRVVGPGTGQWPAMASATFAHTAPVWIGARGSTLRADRQAAARDLLRALDNATTRLKAGYGNAPIPELTRHFDEARSVLNRLASGS
jgi:TolB protein